MHDAPLDGNAAAGVMAEVFQLEMTMAVTTCASCGAVTARRGGVRTDRPGADALTRSVPLKERSKP